MKLPCRNCITLAVCKTKNPLCCSIIYDYVTDMEKPLQTRSDRMLSLRKFFNKEVDRTETLINMGVFKKTIFWNE